MNRSLHKTTLTLLALIMAVPSFAHAVSGAWPAPNTAEDAAIQRGQKLGIGSATLEGPSTVSVRSYQTWTLHYTVGPVGLAKGEEAISSPAWVN